MRRFNHLQVDDTRRQVVVDIHANTMDDINKYRSQLGLPPIGQSIPLTPPENQSPAQQSPAQQSTSPATRMPTQNTSDESSTDPSTNPESANTDLNNSSEQDTTRF